jgi:hypothetical protein
LADIIEPLEIIPSVIISSVYRYKALSNDSDSNEFRGIPYVWDESGCGSELSIMDDGKFVEALDSCDEHQSVRAKIEGIFEWDIIIEEICLHAYIGVCAL